MPDLFGRKNALELTAEAVVDSAQAHGTSNAPVARFAMMAMERIELQSVLIVALQTELREIREHLGMWNP